MRVQECWLAWIGLRLHEEMRVLYEVPNELVATTSPGVGGTIACFSGERKGSVTGRTSPADPCWLYTVVWLMAASAAKVSI